VVAVRRWIAILILSVAFGIPASAAIVKLYLKDGTYQLAREYQVTGDRVKYFSTDREEWEEIPLELVDLKKTEAEVKQRGRPGAKPEAFRPIPAPTW
jgi:hypothetical protein